MPDVQPGTMCANHPGDRAVAACDNCSKPFCDTCRVEDVSTDSVFCSSTCHAAHQAQHAAAPGLSQEYLFEGYRRPIVTGWKLLLRSFPAVAAHIAPLSLLGGLAFMMAPVVEDEAAAEEITRWDLALLVVFLIGIALVQVVMSQKYTRIVHGNAVQWTARRLLHWVATGILVGALVLVGFLALIVPGIIVSLRLFWADEFALMHGYGPIRSMRESWKLTQGEMGKIFFFQLIAGLAAYVPLIVMGLATVALATAVSSLGDQGAGIEFIQGTLISFFFMSFYSAIHAPELVYFYGMRAVYSTPVAQQGRTLGI